MSAPEKYKYLPTGEMMELKTIPPEDAVSSFPFERDGKHRSPQRVTHFARNSFNSWSGCKSDFEKCFRKI